MHRRHRRAEPPGLALTDALQSRAGAAGLHLGPTQQDALAALGRLQASGAAGVYLHGPAGRGKTWLLDAVTASLGDQARRYHWAELFTRLDAEVGRRLTDPDRLPSALDAVVGNCSVLCFDEVHVTDPDDAGMVEHLLRRLLSRGVRVVVTSNQAPDELLADPQWHHWAHGLITLLSTHYTVCHVDDAVDYRSLRTTAAPTGFGAGALLPASAAPPTGGPAGRPEQRRSAAAGHPTG